MNEIPQEVLDKPIKGINLLPGWSLRAQLADQQTLLVFLPQGGLPFSREAIADLCYFAAKDPEYPAVLFFMLGSLDEGIEAIDKHWPAARGICDQNAWFYKAFGLERTTQFKALSPLVLGAMARAAAKWHLPGHTQGDPLQLPGMFLVKGTTVVWQYEYRNMGDHPDFPSIPSAVALPVEAELLAESETVPEA